MKRMTAAEKSDRKQQIYCDYLRNFLELIFHSCLIRTHMLALMFCFDHFGAFPHTNINPLQQNKEKNWNLRTDPIFHRDWG